ncbi:hypothetical protein F2P56_011529 [Juglans regia]|uniref:Uncharacterized protein LOC109001039 n=2 Tax=Juglans regia TaxID=51240 RepID=A0A2I4FPW3_JUGRE|nr:uncharacterized protein LOC109001039 [Juglans regia]KAF5471057.1 hypothetical protein F2P56_011529 [Juglans regia]
MPSRRRQRPIAYLPTVKQKEDEDLKTYLTRFNKERLTTENKDEKITLAALLGGIWPRSPFMAKLARKTPSTLREFMDRAYNFVNAEDTLQALVDPHKADRKAERRSGQVERKIGASRQEKKQEKWPDYNPRLIHENLNAQEDEKDREEPRQLKTGSRYCKYHQIGSHWTEDCTTIKKRLTELARMRELE